MIIVREVRKEMSRLIDAFKLTDYANNTKDKTIDANDIMRFPAVDAVPVVRCKDCIHCSKYDCWTENGIVTLNSCWNDQGIFTYVLDNDYCSRGYRRDNVDTNSDEQKEDLEE